MQLALSYALLAWNFVVGCYICAFSIVLDATKFLGRRVQLRQIAPTSEPNPAEVEEPEEMEQDSLIVVADGSSNMSKEKLQSNTRFLVTMSGVDKKFVDRLTRTEQETTHVVEQDYDDDLDTLIVDVNEEELLEEAMMGYSESNKSTPVHISHGPMPTQQIVNPIKISLEDDDGK